MRPGEPLPPSATGVFPPGQWDRSGAYLDPNDYSRRSSSSSSDSTYPYDRSMPYGDAAAHAGMPKRTSKDGGSGAITHRRQEAIPLPAPRLRQDLLHQRPCRPPQPHPHRSEALPLHLPRLQGALLAPGQQPPALPHPHPPSQGPRQPVGPGTRCRRPARTRPPRPDAADAEAEAKAELGRRALEDGTAIAVVHEVKDQHGRKKGETIERMVGMPRSRRESLRGLDDDARSASPSSMDERVKREASLPGGPGLPLDAAAYEAPNDYWSAQMVKQGRLSLPHQAGAYDPRYRETVPPAPYGREMNGAYGGAPPPPPPAWSQSQPAYLTRALRLAMRAPACREPAPPRRVRSGVAHRIGVARPGTRRCGGQARREAVRLARRVPSPQRFDEQQPWRRRIIAAARRCRHRAPARRHMQPRARLGGAVGALVAEPQVEPDLERLLGA